MFLTPFVCHPKYIYRGNNYFQSPPLDKERFIIRKDSTAKKKSIIYNIIPLELEHFYYEKK